MDKKRGFSLIELMSVIAIIAVLSAIALPLYTKSKCKAHTGEVPSCLSDVALRMENYRSNHGHYPITAGAIPPDLNLTTANCGEYYIIQVWANNTEYYIEATDTQKKLPCSSVAGDDEWVLTNTSPKLLHTKNAINPGKVDPTPAKPG